MEGMKAKTKAQEEFLLQIQGYHKEIDHFVEQFRKAKVKNAGVLAKSSRNVGQLMREASGRSEEEKKGDLIKIILFLGDLMTRIE